MGLDRSLSMPYIDEIILLDVNFKLGNIDWHFLEKKAAAYEPLNLLQQPSEGPHHWKMSSYKN